MHHEVHEGEELFELTKLVSLLRVLLDVEPAFAHVLKGHLDDLRELADPALLASVVPDVGNGLRLLLLELVDPAVEERRRDKEDLVVLQQLVALGPDLDHRADRFLLDVQGLEAEVRETLGEIVLRNGHHTEDGCDLLWWRLRQVELRRNHAFELFLWRLKRLIHDDLVHGAGEILVDFVHDACGVDVGPRLEIS